MKREVDSLPWIVQLTNNKYFKAIGFIAKHWPSTTLRNILQFQWENSGLL